MISVFFILFSIIHLIIIRHFYKKMNIKSFAANPIVIVSIFFYIIHILLPFAQWEDNFFRYKSSYDEETYILSILLMFIAFIIFVVSFQISYSRRILNWKAIVFDNRNYATIPIKKNIYITIIVFFIGLFFVYKNLSIIMLIGQDEYLRDRIGFGFSNGIQMLLTHWVYISCIIFFFLFKIAKKKYVKKIAFLLFIFSFLITILYYSMNSNRNSIFLLFLILIIVNMMFVTKSFNNINIIKNAVVIVIAVTLFFQIGKYRNIYMQDYSITHAINGSFGNHENIVWLMSNNYDLQYGRTYLAGLTNFVPRRIWPDKPVGAGPILKNFIYPHSYVIGESGNSSLTTGFYTELMMNFGLFGIFVFSILYGIFLKKIYLLLLKERRPFVFLFFLYSLILFSSQILYAEFLGFFSRYVLTSIPFIFLILMNKKYKYL